MKHQQISATDFKAKCLALLDEVNESGGSVTITKRGRPVAVLQPVAQKAPVRSLRGILQGELEIVGDIVHFSGEDDWDTVRELKTSEAKAARAGRKAS